MTYKKITSSTNNVFGSRPVRLHRVVLVAGSSEAAAVTLEDAATAGSNDFYKSGNVAANSSTSQSWGGDGLTVNYVSVTLTGANAVCYLYYS